MHFYRFKSFFFFFLVKRIHKSLCIPFVSLCFNGKYLMEILRFDRVGIDIIDQSDIKCKGNANFF